MEPNLIDRVDDTLLEGLADGVTEGVYYVSSDHVVLFWSKRAELITGYSRFEVTGMKCSTSILRPSDEVNCNRCGAECPLAATMKDGQVRVVDATLHRKDGREFAARLRCSPVRDREGVIRGALEVFSEKRTDPEVLTKRLQVLLRKTVTDRLTGVGNRRFGEQALRHLSKSKDASKPFGLVFFDLDHFKAINDRWGHNAGDLVLRQVASVAKSNLRSMDLLCRWGGEEFLALVPSVTEEVLVEIAERIRKTVESRPVAVDGESIPVTLSAGVLLAPVGISPSSLIAQADALLYKAKDAGRNRIVFDRTRRSSTPT